MIELKFTGGGPLDGRELAASGPLGRMIAVSGGCYELWGTAPDDGGSPARIAWYEWVPAGWGD
jgi:hypothetical protein